MGAYNLFKNIETDALSNKTFIKEHLQYSNTSIGIKSSTNFTGKLYQCLLEFTKEFDGLIFNLTEILDEEGELVLATDGCYSVLYE